MDVIKGKGNKKGLIIKTWERCRSVGGGRGSRSSSAGPMTKSKSWPRAASTGAAAAAAPERDQDQKRSRKRQVAPQGCFSVYVGPQKQRFVVKTEYANHPLFKMLLEEAELEYGYNSEGPIALPCNVDFFSKVLVEMDSDSEEISPGCGRFPKPTGSYRPLAHFPMVSLNNF